VLIRDVLDAVINVVTEVIQIHNLVLKGHKKSGMDRQGLVVVKDAFCDITIVSVHMTEVQVDFRVKENEIGTDNRFRVMF